MANVIKYSQPYTIKPRLLAWSELNVHDVETLISLFQNQSSEDRYNYLERFFDLKMSRFRDKILLDLLYFGIKFAINECYFNKVQISAFVSILRAVHDSNQETPFDNFKQLVDYFQGLMVCHSVNRPPFCLKIFTNDALTQSINYVKNTYLKNYKLYKYVFTPIVGINVKLNYSNDRSSNIESEMGEESQSYYPELSIKTTVKAQTVVEEERSPERSEPKREKREIPIHVVEPTEPSTIQTMSSFSSEDKLKSYVRQFIIDELGSEPIKEKLCELEEEVIRNKHNL